MCELTGTILYTGPRTKQVVKGRVVILSEEEDWNILFTPQWKKIIVRKHLTTSDISRLMNCTGSTVEGIIVEQEMDVSRETLARLLGAFPVVVHQAPDAVTSLAKTNYIEIHCKETTASISEATMKKRR